MANTEHDYTAQARRAIEVVCSGDVSRIEEFYSPEFTDHINGMTFHGYDGGRESLAFYRSLFKSYSMGVEEQVAEGNRVASRWVLEGVYHGRAVTLRGITISHLGQDGRILEDRGHSDSIALLGQLGVARTLILGLEVLTRRIRLPKGVLARS
jgi:predicted ester cyclase